MQTIFELSATQEECLADIHSRQPKHRGGTATIASLKRRGLIEFSDGAGRYELTGLGISQLRVQQSR